MQPPEGPPVCTLLRCARAGTAADVINELANGVPSGISTKPVLLTLPTRENTFVPLLLVLPFGEQVGTLDDDGRDVVPGLDVIDVGGFAEQALLGRVGRPWRGTARLLSSERMSAVSSRRRTRQRPSPGSIEVEASPQNVLA
jgi:hypothetical protein